MSNSRSTNTGAPQGCVLSPLLFSLYTNDCTSKDPSVKLGLIQDGDESAYRQEVKELAVWCSLNLELNTLKTVEMIVDFRRTAPARSPPTHHHSTVTAVETSPAEEDQPATEAADTVLLCHHWIRPLYVNNCLVQLSYQIWPQKTTEGSPDSRANHWYNPPHSPRAVLVQSEQKSWQNHSEPLTSAHSLCERLPSGRRYRALSTRTTRHRNSFFPQAIHLMNTWQ